MLLRKMMRDMLKNMTAYMACASIIAFGLMTYISMENVNTSLYTAKDKFYMDYNFSDGFAYVKSMPYNKLRNLMDVPGIAKVNGTLAKDVRVLSSERDDNIYLRLVSINLNEEQRLNDVWLQEGTPLEQGKRNIWVGINFYNTNKLSHGNKLTVIIDGREVSLTVVGKGQSPEHAYVMRNISDFMPSAETFGVAYIPYDVMETLFESKGFINEVAFNIQNGYSFDDIKGRLENILSPYEISDIIEKKDQISNFMLSEELNQLETMSQSIPMLFLVLSSVILWIMLKRLVEKQRTQIGTLKACGFSSFRIICHYILYAVVIGILGGLLGAAFSFVIANYMTLMYNEYFTLPHMQNQFSIKYCLAGISLSVFFSSIAGLLGAKSIIKLEPAEAMLPPSPVSAKKNMLETISFFWNMLTTQGKMAMRNVFRSKGRSAFTALGVAFAFSLMAFIFSFTNMFNLMIMDNFTYIQKYDAKITLSSPQKIEPLIYEVNGMNGVETAEPMLEIPVTLINRNIEKNTVILGVKSNSSLYHVIDKDKNIVPLNTDGLLLSKSLAKKLGVKRGDKLTIESPLAKKEKVEIRVSGIIPQYIGTNGYMQINSLNDLIGENDLASAVILKLDSKYLPELKHTLSKSKIISNLEEKDSMQNNYINLIDQSMLMIYVMAVLAVLTGFAIIYNSGMISFSERERELASMRVLGMSNREVLGVLTFEQLFLSAAGIVLGVPLTYIFVQSLSDSMSTDLYSLPVAVDPGSFIYAFIGTACSLAIAFLTFRKKVKKLDMVEVLKARE